MTLQNWLEPLQMIGKDFQNLGPQIVAALLVIVLGFFLAWIGRAVTGIIMKWSALDRKLSGIWIFKLWSEELHGKNPSKIGENFVFYSVVFVTVVMAIRILTMGSSLVILNSLLSLFPKVLSFMLILFLGAIMAMFFSVVAQWVLAGSHLRHPIIWGKIIAWSTFGVAIFFSLEQLGMVGEFFTRLLLILLAALGLAFGLAFGLGCKDLAREFMIEMLKDDKDKKKRE